MAVRAPDAKARGTTGTGTAAEHMSIYTGEEVVLTIPFGENPERELRFQLAAEPLPRTDPPVFLAKGDYSGRGDYTFCAVRRSSDAGGQISYEVIAQDAGPDTFGAEVSRLTKYRGKRFEQATSRATLHLEP